MAETILNKWITNKDGTKVAPYTLVDDIYMSNGGSKLSTDYQNLKNRLTNVENKSSATIRGELTKSNVTAALGYEPATPQEIGRLDNILYTQGSTLNKLQSDIKKINPQNLLINGDFQCNQRGGDHTHDASKRYGIDMWYIEGTVHYWRENGLVFDKTWQKIPKLENDTYVLSYHIDHALSDSFIDISQLDKTFTDGFLTVNLITEGNYTKVYLQKNDLSNMDRINFVQLTQGSEHYKHVKEDYGLALTRCQRYIEKKYASGYIYGATGVSQEYWLSLNFQFNVIKAANPNLKVVVYDVPNASNPRVAISGCPADGVFYSLKINMGKTVNLDYYITHPVRIIFLATCEPL